LLISPVERCYLNTGMWTFESSQNHESRAQLAGSSKAYRKPRAFKCVRFLSKYFCPFSHFFITTFSPSSTNVVSVSLGMIALILQISSAITWEQLLQFGNFLIFNTCLSICIYAFHVSVGNNLESFNFELLQKPLSQYVNKRSMIHSMPNPILAQ